MFKLRLKNPFLCLFGTLPLLAAFGIDIWIWQDSGNRGFHFSDFGYLIQHYLPEIHDWAASALDHPLYYLFLGTIFRTKTVILGAAMAVISFLIINRPRRDSSPKAARHNLR